MQAMENKAPPRLRAVSSDLESSPGEYLRFVNLIPSGRFDLWWAATQPYGNLTIWVLAYLASKVLRLVFREVIVDLHSLAAFAREMEREESLPICLASMHRSFCDFVLMSYLCFSMPDIGIRVPHTIASSNFRSLWFSFLLEWAQAVWIERGKKDDTLVIRVKELLAKSETILVFLQGTRSRDRRYCPPKKGFLCALQVASADYGLVDALRQLGFSDNQVSVDSFVRSRRGSGHALKDI